MSRARTMRSAEEGETTIKRRTEPRGRLPRHRDQGPAPGPALRLRPFLPRGKKTVTPHRQNTNTCLLLFLAWPTCRPIGPHPGPPDNEHEHCRVVPSHCFPPPPSPPPRLPPVARCFLCAKLPSYLYHHAPCSAKRPDTDLRLPYHPTTRVLPDRINATAALPCPPTQRSPDPTAPLFILHRPVTFLVQLI